MWFSATGRGLLDSHKPMGLPAGQTFPSALSVAGHRNMRFLVIKSNRVVRSGCQQICRPASIPAPNRRSPVMGQYGRPFRIGDTYHILH